MNKTICAIFLVLFNSCISEKTKQMKLIYENCEGDKISESIINDAELFDGKSEYHSLNKQYSINWVVKSNKEFSFSKISDWNLIDDGDDFFLKASGSIGGEKSQILFWKKEGKKTDLNKLLVGTRNALIEKHKNVRLLKETDKNQVYYLEYDIEFKSGKKGHYLELTSYSHNYLVSVGCYFLSESFEIHRRNIFDHLSNVNFQGKKLLNINDLLFVIPLDICSKTNLNEVRSIHRNR